MEVEVAVYTHLEHGELLLEYQEEPPWQWAEVSRPLLDELLKESGYELRIR